MTGYVLLAAFVAWRLFEILLSGVIPLAPTLEVEHPQSVGGAGGVPFRRGATGEIKVEVYLMSTVDLGQ